MFAHALWLYESLKNTEEKLNKTLKNVWWLNLGYKAVNLNPVLGLELTDCNTQFEYSLSEASFK